MALRTTPGRGLLPMLATIVLLHAAGWGLFVLAVLPHGYRVSGGEAFGTGLAATAYLLGARHAFDADHIAAIDNTSRKLTTAGAAARSTGYWFALGHSTVVLAAVAMLAAGMNAVAGQLADDASVLKDFARIWGPAVSGLFLLLIGGTNLVSLRGILRVLRSGRGADDGELERHLAGRGLLNRLLSPVARRVDAPWKMYPLGLLFGLGLDTAGTIGLFVVAGGAVVALPWYAVLVLPLLFAAGMVLCDTVNGVVMSGVYRWACGRPRQKIYYNLAVTLLSVLVAFLVAAVVLGGLFSELTGITSGPVAWLASVDLANAGFIVTGLLAATWLGALLLHRRTA
ncbi:HoxN/HupN/NixA family nickel/cobalt transporter [Arthrobacter mobilis]|uniref:Nickel/cobalt efflux system n=1 Tax=Arthrobacter mobilis TaxID=2724944 RepID=A0A7X6HDB9_9MICC|nr:HoxN/HupN/NixA family nickel/cobalt transporter [Arthrobacter mobilis]NKX55033.1 HoxN/HupN/NixA family nickel/cobalt transporter [Arthrobacter mobilis]